MNKAPDNILRLSVDFKDFLELVADDKNIKIISFSLSTKINNQVVDLSAGGSGLTSEMRAFLDNLREGDSFFIERIIAIDGTVKKNFKGFKVCLIK